jgi:hypothetical protein
MMMMQMWFYQSCQATILFEDWTTSNCSQYAWSVVACILLGVARQLLVAGRRGFRAWVAKRREELGLRDAGLTPFAASISTSPLMISAAEECEAELAGACPSHCKSQSRRGPASRVPSVCGAALDWVASTLIVISVLDGIFTTVTVGAAFLNMLITMTYNGGLFIAVCVGEGIGTIMFDPPVVLCACQRRYFAKSDGTVAACH